MSCSEREGSRARSCSCSTGHRLNQERHDNGMQVRARRNSNPFHVVEYVKCPVSVYRELERQWTLTIICVLLSWTGERYVPPTAKASNKSKSNRSSISRIAMLP